MTNDPESTLFDFAGSNRPPRNEEEKLMTELHAALGTSQVPIRLMHPPVQIATPRWNRHLFAVAAVLLVFAIAAASFVTMQQEPGGSPTEVPPVVLGLASPDSTETVIILGPHEPIPGLGAVERDMPILISYVDSLPDSDGWHRFNPSTRQMQIRFDFDRGYAELAVRNGVEIHSTFYPNIFIASVPNGVQIVNIASLSMISIETEMSFDELERINFPIRASRWMVIPDSSLVIDTSTMSVLAMNQYIAGPVGVYAATASDDGSMLVAQVSLEDETTMLVRVTADGQVEPIATQTESGQAISLVASPDGRYVATRSTEASNTIAIIDLQNGETIASAEIPGRPSGSEPLWVQDGDAVVFAGDDKIQKLTIASGLVETLYEAPGREFVLVGTSDSNMVVAQQSNSGTSLSENGNEDAVQLLVLDVRDGAFTAFDGRDQMMGPSTRTDITRNAAMVEENPSLTSIDELNVTVVDTTTGDVVGTIERPARDTARTGAVKSAWGAQDGDIRFVTWGSQYTFRITNDDGTATLEQVSPPPGPASEGDLAVSIRSSADSGWLAMHVEVAGEWWILDLTSPESQWEQLPDFDRIIFVVADEDIDYPSIQPQASPEPIAEVCDFSGVIPFIVGMDSSPLDEPTVLHRSDRSLVLDCNGEQEPLLQKVMIARPTQTPHVVHAITTDGDYFINIVNREQIFIPAKTDTSTSLVLMQPSGPWMLMRSSANEHGTSVYNLETMTETPIITHARVHLSLDDVADSPVHSDSNRIVIAYPWVSEAGTKYLNGFFVVEADGSSSVIAVGHEPFPRELAVSPDGQIMATASFHGSRGEGTTTVTLFGTQDDTVIEQYELRTMDQPVELTWQHDGSGLLLHDIFNLYRIDAEYPGDGLEILAEGQNLKNLVLTPDNDVVAIGSSVASQTPSVSTLIVHIPSREVIEVGGQDVFASSYFTSTRTTLVLEVSTARPGGTGSATIVDAVSGEALGTVEYEPVTETGFNLSSYGTDEGDTTIVAFGPDSIWRLVDEQGDATLEQIPSPPISDESNIMALTILTSEDGHISIQAHDSEMTSNVWILQPGSTEWIHLEMPSIEETQGMLPMAGFVVGADD